MTSTTFYVSLRETYAHSSSTRAEKSSKAGFSHFQKRNTQFDERNRVKILKDIDLAFEYDDHLEPMSNFTTECGTFVSTASPTERKNAGTKKKKKKVVQNYSRSDKLMNLSEEEVRPNQFFLFSIPSFSIIFLT